VDEVVIEAARLHRSGEPFVMATVVWSHGPTSGKPGSKALIRSDGKVVGWLGGACAEPTVVRAARQALSDGRPSLMYLGPDDGDPAREGIQFVPMACESEGSMEVYLEPVLPAQGLYVVGHSPAARTLAGLAHTLGWMVTVVDDGGSAPSYPEGIVVRQKLDLHDAGPQSFVVVATQGHYDEAALESALTTPARYIGLVSSRKRARSVFEYLKTQGFDLASIDRIHAPAGLDLGHLDHRDMAVAILADLVQRKSEPVTGALTVDASLTEAIDPVCGMTVDVARARWKSVHEGADVYFCAAGCQTAFDANPGKYLT